MIEICTGSVCYLISIKQIAYIIAFILLVALIFVIEWRGWFK
jgi:hypothetical protein